MPKRSRTPPKAEPDANQLARRVMERIEELAEVAEANPHKDPAAVALGRRGGLKGGRARMDSMTAKERQKFALKGAQARWGKPAPTKR